MEGSQLISLDQKDISELTTIREMRDYTKRIYRLICRTKRERLSGKSQGLREELLKFADRYVTDRNLSLAMIAAEYRCSESYISRFFKESIGVSYYEYVNRMSVERARDLIRDSGKPIREVSQMVGYNDERVFRQLF